MANPIVTITMANGDVMKMCIRDRPSAAPSIRLGH